MLISAAHSPMNPTAVQVNATTSVRVSWTAPSLAPTPSGYRIYYQAEGNQTFTTVDTGQEDTEYLLTGLRPGTTYNIRMVALSQYLPSVFQTLEPITIGEQTNDASSRAWCIRLIVILCGGNNLLLLDYRCKSSYHISSSAVSSECQYHMEPGFWSVEICDWV